ncbi:hypothetical protein [Chitinimonas koreensis]|uniref:hypothetical protein n=1 Tax=Chitinimonas koreensis TaxID=356302 RepID=UPI0004181B00|nr:hypothetical protein [Chitinimonas koreensis]QNM97979.1 hypothetical protein H9L41_06900 [Chitinimonas koreensis]
MNPPSPPDALLRAWMEVLATRSHQLDNSTSLPRSRLAGGGRPLPACPGRLYGKAA